MDGKILKIRLSFGSNFGKLRTIGTNRVWCCFLAYTFKVKKDRIDFINWTTRYSQVVKNFIRFYLRKSSSDRVESFGWHFRYLVYTFQTKKSSHVLHTFLSFSVLNFCSRTNGRTKIFRKGSLFSY